MRSEIKLIIPIMPGKTEAWRRFLQTLEGSRSEEFTAWCKEVAMDIKMVALCDTSGGAAIMLALHLAEPEATITHLSEIKNPFERWLFQQINTLHGLDLSRIVQAQPQTILDQDSFSDHRETYPAC